MRLHRTGLRPIPLLQSFAVTGLIVLGGCSQTTSQAQLTTSSLPEDTRPAPAQVVSPTPQQYNWNGAPQRATLGAPAAAASPARPAEAQWHATPRAPYQAPRPAVSMNHPGAPQSYNPATAPYVDVKPGDTLYSIARRNNVSVAALVDTNRLTGPSIQPGQRLLLPAGTR